MRTETVFLIWFKARCLSDKHYKVGEYGPDMLFWFRSLFVSEMWCILEFSFKTNKLYWFRNKLYVINSPKIFVIYLLIYLPHIYFHTFLLNFLPSCLTQWSRKHSKIALYWIGDAGSWERNRKIVGRLSLQLY